MHFHAIFEPFSAILQVDFFLSFSGGCGFENCWDNILFFWVILSRPLIQEGQLSVSDERL